LLFALGLFAPGEAAARVAMHVGPPDVAAQKLVSWGSDPETAVLRQAATRQAAETQQAASSISYDFASGCLLPAENAGLRGVQLNKAIGDATADAIASRYPLALREVPMTTVGGVRRVDVLTLGERHLAIESKVGLTGLDSRIRQELARDWWLRRTGKVDDVIWEFTPSPITGQGGATPALLDKLNKLGIGTVGP